MQPDTLQNQYVFLVDGSLNLTQEGEKTLSFCRLLTDATRIAILDLLQRESEKNVGPICKHVEHSQPAVSFHLAEMKAAEMLKNRKKGKRIFYSMQRNNNHFLTIARAMELTLDRTIENEQYGPLHLEPLTNYPNRSLTKAGDRMQNVAKSLGCDIRIQILASLQSGRLNVTELCEFFERTQPDISHHLGILLDAGFLTLTEVGKFNYYNISDNGKSLLQEFSQQLRRLGANPDPETRIDQRSPAIH